MDAILAMMDLDNIITAAAGGVVALLVVAVVAGLGKLKDLTDNTSTDLDDKMVKAIIEAMVEQGLLTREKADEILQRGLDE